MKEVTIHRPSPILRIPERFATAHRTLIQCILLCFDSWALNRLPSYIHSATIDTCRLYAECVISSFDRYVRRYQSRYRRLSGELYSRERRCARGFSFYLLSKFNKKQSLRVKIANRLADPKLYRRGLIGRT